LHEFFTAEGTEMVFSEISSEARDHYVHDGFQANLREFAGYRDPSPAKTAGSGSQKKFLVN
jgi:hypothetical protein